MMNDNTPQQMNGMIQALAGSLEDFFLALMLVVVSIVAEIELFFFSESPTKQT
jgi:hypothetical protein